jgi:hypothetical protein
MTTKGDDMKIAMLGVGLIGLFAFGCAAEMGGGDEQSTLTIDNARISRSGDKLLVQGISHGQPISQVTDSVLVDNGSGAFVSWQEENAFAGITCYSCTSNDGGRNLKCVRVACPDGLIDSER